MAHTYEELRKKTVAELRDIAKGIQHDAVLGYTQMHKDHLLVSLCHALGIDPHEHHAAVLAEKSAIKARMHELKAAAATATAGGDADLAHRLRRERHALNHALRASAKRTVRH